MLEHQDEQSNTDFKNICLLGRVESPVRDCLQNFWSHELVCASVCTQFFFVRGRKAEIYQLDFQIVVNDEVIKLNVSVAESASGQQLHQGH